MKKYRVKVNGTNYEIEIEEIRDGSVPVPEQGAMYGNRSARDLRPAAPTARPAAPTARQAAPVARPAAPTARPAAPAARPVPPRPSTAAPKTPAQAADGTVVSAPMPGTILSVSAAAGQEVQKGDVLLTVESMKMENEITAPCAGTVQEFNVKTGDTVNTGDTLAVIR